MTSAEIAPGIAERLAAARVAWLTTVRSDGQPQSSCVWFHFDGTDMIVCSEPAAGKVRNIRSNPKVSFHLDGDGQGGSVVTIDAVAEIVEGDPDPERLDAYAAKYDEAIRKRLKTTIEELRGRFSVVLRVTPTRLRAW